MHYHIFTTTYYLLFYYSFIQVNSKIFHNKDYIMFVTKPTSIKEEPVKSNGTQDQETTFINFSIWHTDVIKTLG